MMLISIIVCTKIFIFSVLIFSLTCSGGETAEMPGTYQKGQFEVSGFVVGVVERSQYLPRMGDIEPGDVIIGLHSSGVHSNGYSLVREVVRRNNLTYDLQCPYDGSQTLG